MGFHKPCFLRPYFSLGEGMLGAGRSTSHKYLFFLEGFHSTPQKNEGQPAWLLYSDKVVIFRHLPHRYIQQPETQRTTKYIQQKTTSFWTNPGTFFPKIPRFLRSLFPKGFEDPAFQIPEKDGVFWHPKDHPFSTPWKVQVETSEGTNGLIMETNGFS